MRSLSWSSRYVPSHHFITSTQRVFSPWRRYPVTSYSHVECDILLKPTGLPLSHTYAHESTPSKLRYFSAAAFSPETMNFFTYAPHGFWNGTYGGSYGTGYCVFVYWWLSNPLHCHTDGTSISSKPSQLKLSSVNAPSTSSILP